MLQLLHEKRCLLGRDTMIIDIHTHTFPEKIAGKAVESLSKEAHIIAHTDGTVPGLVKSMEESGVDISLVMPVATDPGQVVKVNDSALRNNEKYFEEKTDGPRVLSFGCIHPEFGDYRKELRRIREGGIKGIKLHPVYQKHDIDDLSFLRIIDCAAENDLIVLTHAGLDVGIPGVVHCSPKMCRNVLDKIGDFKFILAHMGGWRNWEEVPDLLAETCAFLDSSFASEEIEPLSDGYWDDKDRSMLDQEGYLSFIRVFGPDRIIFGSDSPWTSQKKSRQFIEKLPLEQEEIQMILGENAQKLLF